MKCKKGKLHSQSFSKKREVVDLFIQNMIAYYVFVTQLKIVMDYTIVNIMYK